MAIAELVAPTEIVIGVTTISIPAGSNRLLVIAEVTENGASSADTPSVGGQLETQLAAGITISTNLQTWVHVWNEAKIAAMSGTLFNNFAFGSDQAYIYAVYAGVDQTTPIPHTGTDSSAAATPNPLTGISLSTGSGSRTISVGACGNATPSSWTGVTARLELQKTSTGVTGSWADTTSTGTINPRCTWTSQNRACQVALELKAAPAVLAAAVGTFAMTGVAAGLRIARTIAAAKGTFTLSGVAAGLRATRLLAVANGAFVFTGIAVAMSKGRILAVAAGTFAMAGIAAGLRYARVFPAGKGSFTLTGRAVGLLWGRLLRAVAGAFTFTGLAVLLSRLGLSDRRIHVLDEDRTVHVAPDLTLAAAPETRRVPVAAEIRRIVVQADD